MRNDCLTEVLVGLIKICVESRKTKIQDTLSPSLHVPVYCTFHILHEFGITFSFQISMARTNNTISGKATYLHLDCKLLQ
jgi:hypothetical protein